MLTSIFLSFLGAVGIFLIVLSLTARAKPGGLERIARLMGEPGEKARSPTDPSANPIKTFRKHGLAAAIAQADLQVTPAGFIRVGLLTTLLSSLAANGFTNVGMLNVSNTRKPWRICATGSAWALNCTVR